MATSYIPLFFLHSEKDFYILFYMIIIDNLVGTYGLDASPIARNADTQHVFQILSQLSPGKVTK